MNTNTIDPAVSKHPFFVGMDEEKISRILEGAEEVEFEPGDVVFREGEPANRFYLLLSGKVLLETRETDRRTLPIQELHSGDVMGWSWLFPPFSWHFQARVTESTRMVVCNGGHLLVSCEEDPEFGYEVMKRIAQLVIQRLQAGRRRAAAMRSGADDVPTTAQVWDV